MDTAKIIVRVAMPKDVEVIAQAVALGIGDEVTLRSYCGDDYVAVLTEMAREPHEGAEVYFEYNPTTMM